MRQRMVLLTAMGMALVGIGSGCSAIGFVGGTIIDKTMSDETALEVPTAAQIQDSSVTLPKGETIEVETTNGQVCEGIYAGVRAVPVQMDVRRLSEVLESGYVRLFPQDIQQARPRLELASSSVNGKRGPSMLSDEDRKDQPWTSIQGAGESLVTVDSDALLILSDDGPLAIPIYEIKNITTEKPKTTTMRLVILGAITDFILIQGAVGILLASS